MNARKERAAEAVRERLAGIRSLRHDAAARQGAMDRTVHQLEGRQPADWPLCESLQLIVTQVRQQRRRAIKKSERLGTSGKTPAIR